MKKTIFLILLICINLLPLMSFNTVGAQEFMTNTRKKALLKAAMNVIQKRLSTFQNSYLLTFTREKVDRDGDIESYRFIPDSISTGTWHKLDTEYSSNEHDTKVWESDILFNPESFDVNNAKLIKESKTQLIFDMPVSMGISVDSDAVEDKKGALDTFRAELTLGKDNHLVKSYKLYAIKKFNPQFGVTVTNYTSFNILEELSNEGPLVVTKQSESVRGDFSLFISLDEDTEIKNFDFTITQIDKPELD